jgi:predicted DNA-binding transcriptional regulator YafY
MERPQRLLAILVALQTGQQLTASELATQLDVSPRTILRDIDALERADIPVVAERGRYGGITLLPGAQLDVTRLTPSETEALSLVGVDLDRARQLGMEAAARSARNKLATRPLAHGGRLLPLRALVHIDNSGWFVPAESVDVASLARDLRQGSRLRIAYRSSGQDETRTYVVDPRGVYSRGGRWYLIADHRRSARMFALARLSRWEVLDEARTLADQDPLADVAARLVAALEERHDILITALLDQATVDRARRILGSRLLHVERGDGSRRSRIQVGYGQLDGIRQLLQFADHIEITDPPEARVLFQRLAEHIAQQHR